jgi:hypothetical protein
MGALSVFRWDACCCSVLTAVMAGSTIAPAPPVRKQSLATPAAASPWWLLGSASSDAIDGRAIAAVVKVLLAR